MRTTPWRSAAGTSRRPGFTLLELIIAVILIGVLAAVAIPRLRPSPSLQVRSTAAQMANDLEQARTRAMTTRRPVRVAFEVGEGTYAGFLGTAGTPFAQSEEEMRDLRAFGRRSLEAGVEYGRGSVPALPGDAGDPLISIPDRRVEFDGRGTTVPFGTRGVIYLRHDRDADAVAAVSINGAGTFRIWHFVNGVWQ